MDLSDHMVRNKLCWDANELSGTFKTKESRVGLLRVPVPLRYLRPSIIYSVPCDRIVQRTYYPDQLFFWLPQPKCGEREMVEFGAWLFLPVTLLTNDLKIIIIGSFLIGFQLVEQRYIENNKWSRGDMKFIFECSHRYRTSERSERVRYRMWTREDKFHISKRPCIILFII